METSQGAPNLGAPCLFGTVGALALGNQRQFGIYSGYGHCHMRQADRWTGGQPKGRSRQPSALYDSIPVGD